MDNLVDRSLALTDTFLSIIDGSKALRAAVVSRWKGRVVLARCQVHKKRNVAEHLSQHYAAEAKRRMNVAYGMKSYEDARKVLDNTVRWLDQISEPAARSLEEGIEETLTVVKLGLPDLLRRSFSTTNPIESILDGVVFHYSSRGLPVVEPQEPAEAISTSDGANSCGRQGERGNQPVSQALMIPFGVIMNEVSLDRSIERGFAEEDHLIQALRPDRPNPSLGEGVEVGFILHLL